VDCPEAIIDTDTLAIRWFDYWLKDIDTGIMEEPPIMIRLPRLIVRCK